MFSQPRAAGFLTGQQEFSAANPWFSAKQTDGVTHFPALQIPVATAAEIEPFAGKPDFRLFYLPLITILKCGTVGRANRPRRATERRQCARSLWPQQLLSVIPIRAAFGIRAVRVA